MRIGLVVDSERQPWNVHHFVDWARSRPDLEIVCLLIWRGHGSSAGTPAGRSRWIRRMRHVDRARAALLQLLCRIERFLMGLAGRSPAHLHQRDLSGFPQDRTIDLGAADRPSMEARDAGSGRLSVARVADETLEKIADLQLDLLAGFVPGLPLDDLAPKVRIGAISLEHEGEAVGAAGTGAFWATLRRYDSSGFVIRKHVPDARGDEVLTQGRIRNRFSFLWNQGLLYRKSLHYLEKHVAEIATDRGWPATRPCASRSDALAGRLPDASEQASYFRGFLSAAVNRTVRERLLGKAQRFTVCYARQGWKQLDMRQAIRIGNPANAFLADPFLLEHEGRTYCFVEEVCFHDRRGRIAAYELGEAGARRIGAVISELFHMSFPFVFRYGSKIYMIPETSANRDVRIYECVQVPDKWVLRKILMNDVAMADTLVFERDGRWWMLGNLDPADSGDFCSELHVFFADHPLSDRWTPHPENPVLMDPRSARNGGILFDGDAVYRVSQRQAFDVYGDGLSVNRIDVLTPENYAESEWTSGQPPGFGCQARVHHLHSNGRFSVFDRWAFERTATGTVDSHGEHLSRSAPG